MASSKFVVFKTEDWEKILSDGKYLAGWSPHTENKDFNEWTDKIIDDAVVIRTSDVFAAPAFYSYANTIQTTKELLSVMGADEVLMGRLDELSSFFMNQGDEAAAVAEKRIPG